MCSRLLAILFVLLSFAVSADPVQREMIPPFCANATALLSPEVASQVLAEDAQMRELLVMQAMGPEGLLAVHNAVQLAPFKKIESEAQALALVERVMNDPTAYGPVMAVLNGLSPSRSWALYLNTGFHAVSTHTEGHRSMVQQSVEQFPITPDSDVLDIGIGNGNLVIAAAIRNPFGRVGGLDIAGAGLNISNWRMNQISDLASQKYNDPGLAKTGRFWLGRGSATDASMFAPETYDAASMVLTLFAVPKAQRAQALRNAFATLKPGARFVLIDPVPKVGNGSDGRQFLREIVKDAYRRNTDLTVLDVVMLTAKNSHQLLNIEFMEPAEQIALAEAAGFRAVGPSQSVYYGIANLQVFEKP